MENIHIIFSITFLLMFSSFRIRSSEVDMEIIRKRIVEDLMRVPVNDDRVLLLINSIMEEDYWSDINYKDLSRQALKTQNILHI